MSSQTATRAAKFYAASRPAAFARFGRPEPPVRGAIFGLAPWLLVQVAVMPMMGMSFFSGSVSMAMGSLLGHIMYGGVVGAVYGEPSPRPEAVA